MTGQETRPDKLASSAQDGDSPYGNRGFAGRLFVRFLHRYFFLTRGMTLGVRAACFDAAGRVFRVRHTYVPGWHLPGGGVERFETARMALEKEIREEGNLFLEAEPQLVHVYFNRKTSKRDHVLLYRCSVRQEGSRPPDREIAECGFFALDALPAETTPATRARLAEIAGTRAISDHW